MVIGKDMYRVNYEIMKASLLELKLSLGENPTFESMITNHVNDWNGHSIHGEQWLWNKHFYDIVMKNIKESKIKRNLPEWW